MKILSWNIYKKNRNIEKAVEFLRKQDVDVICLQEFPIAHVDALKSLGLHMATCKEVLVYKDKHKPKQVSYSVILSRHPLRQAATIAHKRGYVPGHYKRDRYAHFQADSLFADIDTAEGPFRIFNAHFKCMAGPYHRLSQFMDVVSTLDQSRHNIVCGDFNSFGKPWINWLIWRWFGYDIQEIPINEKKRLTELLQLHGLKNPLDKEITFLKFPTQLDYILVPEYLSVKEKRTALRLYGSDHFPVMLEV